MDEFLCLTLSSRAAEPESEFARRLVSFWTLLLRTQPETYEAVFAEATEFEAAGDRLTRQYMVAIDSAPPLRVLLSEHGLESQPIDPDDTFSRAEASSSDWFQIDH